MKNLWILEINHDKWCNSGTKFDKTCTLTISAKYLHVYWKIAQLKNYLLENHNNQSWKSANFTEFRQNNMNIHIQYNILNIHNQSQKKSKKSALKKYIFRWPVAKNVRLLLAFWKIAACFCNQFKQKSHLSTN